VAELLLTVSYAVYDVTTARYEEGTWALVLRMEET
jgi:hypothetical protein